MDGVLTVSQINRYLKSIIDYDENLRNIYVCGEISNFTNHYRTGHFYFTVKDNESAMKAVMFRTYAQEIKFEPYDGLKVILRCSVSVYERDGLYQLYVTDMMPDGLGALQLAFEQLRDRLEREGLFLQEHKKSLPLYPEKIAVITSPTGAALQDIINVISRRNPCCELIILPVQVQGDKSPGQIVSAIKKADSMKIADLIILARGGGSIEDLWAFNDEAVARAIYDCEIPVVTGIGHETDFTIADFVSDRRGPTPSAAAEISVFDISDIKEKLNFFSSEIKESMLSLYEVNRIRLELMSYIIEACSPEKIIAEYRASLKLTEEKLKNSVMGAVKDSESRLSELSGVLDALSPLKVLSRGYSLIYSEDGSHVHSVNEVSEGDKVRVKLRDGQLDCGITGIIKEEM